MFSPNLFGSEEVMEEKNGITPFFFYFYLGLQSAFEFVGQAWFVHVKTFHLVLSLVYSYTFMCCLLSKLSGFDVMYARS